MHIHQWSSTMKFLLGPSLFVIYIHESPEVCEKFSYFILTLMKYHVKQKTAPFYFCNSFVKTR